jgi:hypothetical protein
MAELFRTPRVFRRPDRTRWSALVGAALAAGIAGFVAGLGTGQWMASPGQTESIAGATLPSQSREVVTPASYVQLTDLRVSAGLDFSQSLEPFHVQLASQEGL